MCGLSQVRFVTAGALENTTLKAGKVGNCHQRMKNLRSFPSGIPGFPKAIRRSDFEIAWQTARGSELNLKRSCARQKMKWMTRTVLGRNHSLHLTVSGFHVCIGGHGPRASTLKIEQKKMTKRGN